MTQNVDQNETSIEDKVHIVGRNLQVTEAMRDHILLRIRKLSHLTPQVLEVQVYLEIQKTQYWVEFNYKFSHFRVVTHAILTDMYAAIDLATGRLRRKLEKWKTRIQAHHGKKLSEALMDMHVLDRETEELLEINDQIEEETLQEVEEELKPPSIVEKEKYSVPMLTLDEAAMRLELSDDRFLVFKCEEDQTTKVLYVRKDRKFGLLEFK